MLSVISNETALGSDRTGSRCRTIAARLASTRSIRAFTSFVATARWMGCRGCLADTWLEVNGALIQGWKATRQRIRRAHKVSSLPCGSNKRALSSEKRCGRDAWRTTFNLTIVVSRR